jgi:hypothetical protein
MTGDRTRPGQTPDEPGARRQADAPYVPAQQPELENLRELHEPFDLPDPYCDFDPPHLPPNAIVIDRIRGWQPDAPPSLAELLASIRTREPEPEPGLEAEP